MSLTVASLSLFPQTKSHHHRLAWENGLHACETMVVVVLLPCGDSEKCRGSEWLIKTETQGLSALLWIPCGKNYPKLLDTHTLIVSEHGVDIDV